MSSCADQQRIQPSPLGSYLDRLDWSPERLAREINRRHGAGTISPKAPYGWLKGSCPRGKLPGIVAQILRERLGEHVTEATLWPERFTNADQFDGNSMPRRLSAGAPPTPIGVDRRDTPGDAAVTDRRKRVFDALDAQCPWKCSWDILFHLDHVESVLAKLCGQEVSIVLGLSPAGASSQVFETLIHVFGDTYLLKIRPDRVSDHTLYVVIQNVLAPELNTPGRYEHSIARIENSIGRYDSVVLQVPSNFGSVVTGSINACVVDVLSTGYYWLEQECRRAFRRLASPFELEVANRLQRQMFAHGLGDLVRDTWIFEVFEDRVFYVISDEVTDRLLSVARRCRELQQSPVTILSALLANSIPRKGSYSDLALMENRTVEADFTDPAYLATSSANIVCENHLSDKPRSIAPLVNTAALSLVAAFPTGADGQIHEVLQALRVDLTQYVEESTDLRRSPIIRG